MNSSTGFPGLHLRRTLSWRTPRFNPRSFTVLDRSPVSRGSSNATTVNGTRISLSTVQISRIKRREEAHDRNAVSQLSLTMGSSMVLVDESFVSLHRRRRGISARKVFYTDARADRARFLRVFFIARRFNDENTELRSYCAAPSRLNESRCLKGVASFRYVSRRGSDTLTRIPE